MAEQSPPKRFRWPGSVASFVAVMTASLSGQAAPPDSAGDDGDAAQDNESAASSTEEGREATEASPLPQDGVEEDGSEGEPQESEGTVAAELESTDPTGPQDPSAGEEEEQAAVASADPPTDPAPAEEGKVAPRRGHPEDENGWLSWPFTSSEAEGVPAQRWATIGGFVGWVHRPSRSDRIDYRPGIAYGGFIRPELTSWLGLRLFYREERLPVKMDVDAYEVDGEELELDFTQPDLEIMNLGGRLEPTWVIHPRLRVHGIIGYAWLQMRAPAPQADGFEIKKTFRTAAQTELTLGAGLSVDIIQDWLGLGVDVAHSIPTTRWGDAYDRHQVIVDGEIRHLSPLPQLRSGTDVLVSVGLIL